jgi:hypothetical protein
MTMQDDEAALALQPARQVDFLGREELLVEAACGAKRRRLAEEKRACSPPCHPAESIPGATQTRSSWRGRHRDRAATSDISARLDRGKHVLEKLGTRRQSASTKSSQSPEAARAPALRALAIWFIGSNTTHVAAARASSAVRSFELLSQTISSLDQPRARTARFQS